MEINLKTPLTEEKAKSLKAGDTILLSGTIYTARDAAHKRLIELVDMAAKPGEVIGSAGPTTSYRMDPYAPILLDLGLKGMIGKGSRSEEVINAIIRNKGIYFGAIGGAGALIGKSIISSEIIAYNDLGAEAIRKIEVKDMPLVVIVDTEGNNLYEIGQKKYLDSKKAR
ncbi:MAG: fumarate hydratase C-terminal domain-containing protein [Clostridium sp.]|uniref:fumarate hydratase C-terminal domain-containing protein n=1 Tax=Clostridium sp. TaxID=1506 RepID=UPI002580AC64|nr:fumarate hydratase C-terminal domain-containing protein [Clostridium sp.]MBS6889502.1 fumarate hydratase C-terminal domain-containing protein [Clostridium sp.]